MPMRCTRSVLFFALFLLIPIAHGAPRVVASIKPVHALVAGVMQGAGTPELLVQGGASPHTYVLRPSDAKALRDAQVVFWVGEGLEGFLQKPLAALAGRATVVELLEAQGLTRLPARAGGIRDGHAEDAHAHEHDHGHDGHDHGDWDPHFWLGPQNAKRAVEIVRATLSAADPANGAIYARNAQDLARRLDALDGELQTLLQPVRQVPFLVFHDAYQYLEHRYGLAAAGAVTISAEQRPGARRIAEIRAAIKAAGVRCIFHEPQFPTALIDAIVEDTGVRTGTLDPLGAELAPGPEAYFGLMRNAAMALRQCLAP